VMRIMFTLNGNVPKEVCLKERSSSERSRRSGAGGPHYRIQRHDNGT
jgi:hypothetical protein